jgi:hypothetical protein
MSTISIAGLDKAELLAALYNRAQPQGMGLMHFVPGRLSRDEAQLLLDDNDGGHFDYLRGRVMKVYLRGESLDTWGYNRDNGVDAAETIVRALRAGKVA